MGFLLLIVIVAAILYYTKVYNSPNAKAVRAVCQGKTPEQKKVIEYFCKEGCMTKTMDDEEYLSMVRAKRDSLNLRQKALTKIGLDEDEVSEIPPASFEGFVYKNAYAKKRANGNWVSSSYQVAWLFFSSTQIYIYRYTFNMDEDKKTLMSSSTKMLLPSPPVLNPNKHMALAIRNLKLNLTNLKWLFLEIRFSFLWMEYLIPKISFRL